MLRRWLRRLRTDKKIIIGLLVGVAAAFALMQFWPLNRDNPTIVSEPAWDNTQTQQLTERACFDCHHHQHRRHALALLPHSPPRSPSIHRRAGPTGQRPHRNDERRPERITNHLKHTLYQIALHF